MNVYRLPIILGLGLLATACGGGGGGSEAPPPVDVDPPPVGGIGRTGLAIGPIANFGSIVVNGVRYDTSNATFVVDDQPGTEADLAVGQVVTVKGEIDDDGGTADEVIYDETLEGPIASIDAAAGSFVVLGQTVIVNAGTSFDDDFPVAGIDGLAIDDIVEISGFVDSNGNIVATRVEIDDDPDGFEVKGVVEALDAAAQTFELRGLTVDYGSALIEGDFPGGEIADGNFVEVDGTTDPNDAQRLIASRVEYEDRLGDFENDDNVEIEGLITRFVDATDFDVNGLAVTTTASTEYENGDAAALGTDVRIEVEGRFDIEGVIVADEIEFRTRDDARIDARVDAVDASAGTLTVLGIEVSTGPLTRFEDKLDGAGEGPLNLADINVGDYVRIIGGESPAGSNAVAATRLERDDDEGDVSLRGAVDSIAEPTLAILGVTIETGAGTEFRGADEQPLGATEFFSALTIGDLVEADGVESSATVIVADEVSLEDD